MELNNRELAVLIWLTVFLAWALCKPELRSSLGNLARTAARPVTLIPLLAMMAFVATLAYAGWRVGVWYPSMITGTVVWFVSSAVALLVNISKVWGEPTFFRRKSLSLLAPTVFVEYLANLYAFNFFVEILLQPILAILVMLSSVASKEPQSRPVKHLADTLLALASMAVIGFAVFQFVSLWDQPDASILVLNFALPVWLTIGILPFIYIMAAYAAYKSSFRRIGFFLSESDNRSRQRVKLALLTTLRGDLRHVVGFVGYWVTEADSAGSFAATREVIKKYLASKCKDEALVQEKRARLVMYSGIVGTDSAGRQLDRREFEETTDALNWLAFCQMGWHNNNSRYRDDLMQVFKYGFNRKGLPDEHGITMYVAEDGQAWWAWRRTITGWCFAVGAAGPPPDRWEFDGPEPPDGFPGQGPRWGNEPFSLDSNRNWLSG